MARTEPPSVIPPTVIPYDRGIFEATSPEGLRFSAAVKRFGLPVHGIREDVTSLWYDDLAKRPPHPHGFFGLTLPTSLFCLEVLARDLRMRVAFRADHRLGSGGSVEHVLSGPVKLVEECARSMQEGGQWVEQLAHALAHFDCESSLAQTETVITAAGGMTAEHLTTHLTTWIIAPVRTSKGNSDDTTA